MARIQRESNGRYAHQWGVIVEPRDGHPQIERCGHCGKCRDHEGKSWKLADIPEDWLLS